VVAKKGVIYLTMRHTSNASGLFVECIGVSMSCMPTLWTNKDPCPKLTVDQGVRAASACRDRSDWYVLYEYCISNLECFVLWKLPRI